MVIKIHSPDHETSPPTEVMARMITSWPSSPERKKVLNQLDGFSFVPVSKINNGQ